MLKTLREYKFIDFFLLVTIVLIGGFNEYVSCIASAVLSVYLILKISKNKQVTIKADIKSLSLCVICVFYLISCLWAVDSGMAFIGFFKFLPIVLYAVSLWQEGENTKVLEIIPFFAAVLVLISSLLMQFEVTASFFSVSGRLAGFFQYPNTFALFLLISQLLLLEKEHLKIYDYITLAVLIGGILYTGSRTVFILLIVSNLAMLLFTKSKRVKIILAVALLLMAIVVGLVLLIWGENSIFGRLLSISLTESTFVGRILYLFDALPLIIKYPFGMGYMGYYYIQGSIQTGVYSVAFAHNDFLQIFLDIGIIPAVLFIASIVVFLAKKNVSIRRKIIVATLCLHSLFDFNLQFIAMFCILILLMQSKEDKTIVVTRRMLFIKVGLAVICALSVYVGAALGLAHFGLNEASDKLYPYYTQNKLTILEKTEEIDEAVLIADEILKHNESSYVPYSVKAKHAYSKGDFDSLIRNKDLVFEKNPFEQSEYEEYCRMLINGIMLYSKAGDYDSVKVCAEELVLTKERLSENKQRLSGLGKMIKDQPITELSREVLNYIEQLEGVSK